MKQKRCVSMIGAAMVLCAVFVCPGCDTAAGNTEEFDISSFIPQNEFGVEATGEADSDLKGTQWVTSDEYQCTFFETGNIASFYGLTALYTVNGTTVSFDFTKECEKREALSFDGYIELQKKLNKELIAKIKQFLQTHAGQQNKDLKETLNILETTKSKLENPSMKDKQEFQNNFNKMKNYNAKVKQHGIWKGALNAEKTEMTIQNFPRVDKNDIVTPVKIIFKKRS